MIDATGKVFAGKITIDQNDPIRTYVHELAHALEWQITGLSLIANQFLARRASGEQAKPLKDVIGPSYDPDEKGWKDDFDKTWGKLGWYVGKYYPHGTTEILSMGFQLLYEDPGKLLRNDPQFFKFLLGVLDGSLL